MSSAEIWLARQPVTGTPRLRLFCLPYAGGGAQIFRRYSEILPANVEVCAVQLPGREKRFGEPSLTSVDEIAESLMPVLRREMGLPYAIFGHSLGALAGFDLARRIRNEGGPLPVHLFASGNRAPQLPDPDPPIHHLPDEQFIQALREFNGTENAVLESRGLLEALIPMLRADFTAAETYVYRQGAPLECPITAFGGSDDPMISPVEIEAWNEQTTGRFDHCIINGDHFFIHQSHDALMKELRSGLEAALDNLVAMERPS